MSDTILSAEQVAAALARAEAAREATRFDVWYPGYGDGSFHCSNQSCDRKLRVNSQKWHDINHNDHNSTCKVGKVAKSLADVPALCATVQALRSENARLREALEQYADHSRWACDRCLTQGLTHTRNHTLEVWLGNGEGPELARAALNPEPAA